MKKIIKKLLKEGLYNIKESSGYPVVVLSTNSLISRSKSLVEEVCDWVYYNNGNKETIVSNEQILNLLQSDLNQLLEAKKANDELAKFEELLVDALGDGITLNSMDVDDYKRLMNPNATLDSLNAPKGSEHDSLLDKDGNLNYGSGEQVNFEKPIVNVANFERFVKKNPEYKKHFDKWYKMMTATTVDREMHIYHEFSFSIKDFERAIKAVKDQNVSAKVIVKI